MKESNEVCPTILGKPHFLLNFYDKVEFTHETPPATGIASFRSATICTLTLQDAYVNKLRIDIKLYFPVSADFIPVSRKPHIIKQLFLCKMRTLLNYSFYKF